jgi:hypothetical protein
MRIALALLLVLLAGPSASQAQNRSAGGAFLRSLVLPGWGHYYAHGGEWGRSGTFFALTDVALALGAGSSEWRRQSVVQSYETLASGSAAADVAGKNRTFFLRLATYQSSDEFLEVSLRNRAWDDLDYVSDPAFQWQWASEEDFQKFRELREEGETLRRRRIVLIATLVGNRILSGFSAARSVRRGRSPVSVALVPVRGVTAPMVNVAVRF